MPRLVFYVSGLLVGWMLATGVGWAQSTAHFRLHSDRLQRAKALEREAAAKGDSLLLAEAWYLHGKLHVLAGDYPTAQAYFMRAFRVHEPRGDSNELSRLYVRLSENEARLGRLDESIRLANRSLAMAQRIQSDIGLIRAYDALGHLYERKWKDELADSPEKFGRVLAYYRQQEQLCYKLKDSMGIAEASIRLGSLLTKTSNRRAIPYLKKAVYLFGTEHKYGNIVDAMLHLVSAYIMTGQIELARQTLSEAEQIYVRRQLDDYSLRLDLNRRYVLYHQATNQWKEAFEYVRKQHMLETNQLLADNDGAIARLNVEYETEKKEALLRAQRSELALETERRRTQERFTWATSALFVIAAGVGLVFFRLNQKNQRISRRNEELVKEQNHRVKNNLQVVSSLLSLQANRLTDETAKQAVEESRLRVQSMAILHRRLYDREMLATVDVAEFIREVTGEVLNTFGYSFLPVQYAIDEVRLSADKATPLGLILNELVTNACKYAFSDQDDPSLSISCRRVGQRLRLEVVDNGPGMGGTEVLLAQTDELLPPRHRSFGMTLIQTQVAQLHGTGGFSSPVGGGTRFTLDFNA